MTPDPAWHRYDGIALRNLFKLQPEKPPIVSSPLIQTLLPTLKLTGITTITGHKLALLRVQFPPKPGQPAREQSLMLTEGQRYGDIGVVEIDEKTGLVKVSVAGTIKMLTFDTDGIKEPAVPVQPASAPK